MPPPVVLLSVGLRAKRSRAIFAREIQRDLVLSLNVANDRGLVCGLKWTGVTHKAGPGKRLEA